MEKAKVYFTDFRTPAYGDGLTTKLQKMLKKAVLNSWIWRENSLPLKCILESWGI